MKDIALRAFHTFWQAALGYFMYEWSQVDWVFSEELINMGTAAFAAGLSALKTLSVVSWDTYKGKKVREEA